MSYLDPNAISRLGSLPLKARIIVEGALGGLHRARQRGSSVEFAEHKEYAAGDDTRNIDWKVFAKADRYYVKQFEQESELTAYLVLDASGSMGYRGGGISKLEYASYLLSALAYLLIKQRDKVGLLVFGDTSLERYVPARARPRHLHDLLTVIDEVNAVGGKGDESVGAALDRLAELSRRQRSLIFLASDMFDKEQTGLKVLRHLRARGHDVTLFHTLDPTELSLPFEGLTVFESMEGPARLLANPGAIRRQYKRRMKAFLEHVTEQCTSGGIEYRPVPTDRPLEQSLVDFIAARSRGTRTDALAEDGSWVL